MTTHTTESCRDGGGAIGRRLETRRLRGEKGYVLAVTGLLLLPLLVFTAFAVDLGSWYAQGARMQRALDAASLAGVVQLPNQTNAAAAADAVMKDNGYDMSVYCPLSNCYTYPAGAGQQMSITLTAPASQYFSQIVIKGEKLTRAATAVYNLRIPLGSPSNQFGATALNQAPNVFGAINGPYSNHADGDPYSTRCGGNASSANSCGSVNATYRNTGFLWAVDVPATALNNPITVAIFDPSLGNNSNLKEGVTGDGFQTSYELFNTSGSSANIDLTNGNSMKTLGRCSNPTTGYYLAPYGNTLQNQWYSLCTFTPTVAGIYPLQVKTSAIPGVTDYGGGYNAYSVRAVSTMATCAILPCATQPSTYALNDMSIWTPSNGSVARFYLANIGQQYAGHTLVVDLYDPGDGTAGATPFKMQFLAPPSGLATMPTGGTTVSCDYNTAPSATLGGATNATDPVCNITTLAAGSNAGIYNNGWLRVAIDIPVGYTCSTDCWWQVKYDFGVGSTPTDRTVWVVNVLGDPVHLVK